MKNKRLGLLGRCYFFLISEEMRKMSMETQREMFERFVNLVKKGRQGYIISDNNLDHQIKPKDRVNHPDHYTSHPSGIECIQVTEYMGFNLGNATKYIWRADFKNDAIEDMEKAIWYLKREIRKRKKENEVQD